MTRKRLTQQFPFLLPLRQFERKLFFYGHMRLDGNRYARTRADSLLPYETFFTTSPLLNYDSGFPMEYQFNKVFNLKLAADCVDRLVIRPGETFSFWQSVHRADRNVPYKDGLNLQDGQITGSYGGGLCQLSTMLYWLFLHTPLTVTERHAHGLEQFPPTTHDLPVGTDATISEGWLDLKVRNDTPQTWQLLVNFDEENMYGAIRCNEPASELFEVYNGSITYLPDPDAPGRTLQRATVNRRRLRQPGILQDDRLLYVNECRIGYPVPGAGTGAAGAEAMAGAAGMEASAGAAGAEASAGAAGAEASARGDERKEVHVEKVQMRNLKASMHAEEVCVRKVD